jgi:hypothetical protein
MAKIPVLPKTKKTKTKSDSPSGGPSEDKSGGGGYDPRAAEKRAIKRENEAKKKAGKKYLAQAANLEIQAKTIRDALKNQFGKGRDQNLDDISQNLSEQISLLKSGAEARAGEFLAAGKDTETAAAGVSEQNVSNLVRERQDSMANILQQGAGETDALRAMVMSARNWAANQSESNRAYFDTMRSVNQGITDLNIDTQGAMANAHSDAESERERIWQDYYNRRGEAFTQLGNIRGQQADYYASAKEMGLNPKKRTKKAEKGMKDAFNSAAKEAGKSYEQQGLPNWVKDYQGQEEVEARQGNSNLASAMTFENVGRAEGATLRKWAA